MARNMVQDLDLIARVYPHDPAGNSQEIILKHPWCIAKEREPQPQSRTSRESTVEAQGEDELEDLPYLELRFSQLPRSSSGFVFGTSKATSDVVLPGWPGISRNHFALTYKNTFRDGNYRLVVRDLGSTSGTVVTYDKGGSQRRSNFDWTVSGFAVPASAKSIIIEPHKSIRFRLVVTHHNLRSPTYVGNVERFRRGAAAAEDLLGVLGFQHGPETERSTGIHTPLEIPVLIKLDSITQDTFKVGSHYWNVSNGEEYVCEPCQHPAVQPLRQPSQHPAAQPPRLPSQHPAAQPPRPPSQHPAAQPSRPPSQHPAVQPPRQPSQPPGQSSQPVLPPAVNPGVALRETLTVSLFPSSGYKIVVRRDGRTLAMYDLHPLGNIKLTSLLAGMGLPRGRQDYLTRSVPSSKKDSGEARAANAFGHLGQF